MKFKTFLKTLSDEQLNEMTIDQLKEAYSQAQEQEAVLLGYSLNLRK